MKIYRKGTVYDAAKERFRWLMEEFGGEVSVSVSGGKDSIICWNMALEAAREGGYLPLKTVFLDQEAEWEATIEQITHMMYHPDVKPYWLQIPMRMSNATSSVEQWLRAWDPDERHLWMRERDPIAITENTFGTDRFHKLFEPISRMVHPYGGAGIVGLRGEEAPTRMLALTTGKAYKGRTWFSFQSWGRGKYKSRERFMWSKWVPRYSFYPIYDWSYTDVWKAIEMNGWRYPSVYDAMAQYGVPPKNMRISHLHHEEAVGTLKYLQEIEPQTWERLTARVQGIDSYEKVGFDFVMQELPTVFKDWKEYRDYLLPRLITDPIMHRRFRSVFAKHDKDYVPYLGDETLRVHVEMILKNDWEGALLKQYNIKARRKLKQLGAIA